MINNNIDNFHKNQMNGIMDSLFPIKTSEPDDVETELVEGAVDRDGSYEQAYSEYVSEELKSIIGNRFN
mgnify:CR=1 FL=1